MMVTMTAKQLLALGEIVEACPPNARVSIAEHRSGIITWVLGTGGWGNIMDKGALNADGQPHTFAIRPPAALDRDAQA